MALIDIVSNPANLSTIIEFIGLVGTIFLFFRKANEENQKQIGSVKEDLLQVNEDLRERIDDAEKRLCQRVAEVKLEIDKLENNFYVHVANGRYKYTSNPLSNLNRENEERNGNNHS